MDNNKREFAFNNGQKVREKVTGFEGIITGTCFYLTGCNQYLVTAKAEPPFDKEVQALWYDEGRLELVEDEEGISQEEVKSKDNGCDVAPTIGKRGA